MRQSPKPLDEQATLVYCHICLMGTKFPEAKMPNIRIDREVYRWLQERAAPFVDTPNDVLRRLLGLDRDELQADKDAASGSPHAQTGASGTRARRRKVTHRSRSGRRKPAPRAPAGALLPEQEYVTPLLLALSDRGGTAPAREIIEAVGRKLESRLTPADKEKTSSGVIRWQNRIQFVRLRLVEEGLLARDSGRGIWSLTDAGRARIKDLPEALSSRR